MPNLITKILCTVLLSILNSVAYSSERLYVTQDIKKAFDSIKKLSKDYSFAVVVEAELPSGKRYKMVEFYKNVLILNTKIISKKIQLMKWSSMT